MDLVLVTAPSAQPVSLEEAKAQARAGGGEDALIGFYIASATAEFDGPEGSLGRALMPQIWALHLDGFPSGAIALPLRPLRGIQKIEYVDPAGATQTLPEDQYVALEGDVALIEPAYGASFPPVRSQRRAVTITFEAGYANAEAVPAPIRLAILLRTAELYDSREPGQSPATDEAISRLLWKRRARNT